MECIKCNTKTTKDPKNPIFTCDSCRDFYCGECSGLNASEVRCMTFQKRTLIFYCEICRKGNILRNLEEKITGEVKNICENIETQLKCNLLNEIKKITEIIADKYNTIQGEIAEQVASCFSNLSDNAKKTVICGKNTGKS